MGLLRKEETLTHTHTGNIHWKTGQVCRGHLYPQLLKKLRQMDCLSPGVGGPPGQHSETPISKKYKDICCLVFI